MECVLNHCCTLTECNRRDLVCSTLLKIGSTFIARADGDTGSSGLSKYLYPHEQRVHVLLQHASRLLWIAAR